MNLAMTRLYARAFKGQRAYGKRPQKRDKNVTMIGALAGHNQHYPTGEKKVKEIIETPNVSSPSLRSETVIGPNGALEPWFDKTWRPGEIELVK
jgi:hypothetical protein